MKQSTHLDRIKLATAFYAAVLVVLASSGLHELSTLQTLLGGGAIAASTAYYRHAQELV